MMSLIPSNNLTNKTLTNEKEVPDFNISVFNPELASIVLTGTHCERKNNRSR